MSDQFWMMLGVVLPVLIVQVFQYIAAKRNAEKAAIGREEIKAQVCEVKDAALATKQELSAKVDAVTDVAVRSRHEITQAFQAGERAGYVGGIEVGIQQATDFGGLSKQKTDFNPLS